ncbi:hypothetical protein BDV32DRAFT_133689 [Aspergillus pseudonomiae]|nr:hypothetical protein BDV32DRAFT_133689 [Aspergillus pseudonomiae]
MMTTAAGQSLGIISFSSLLDRSLLYGWVFDFFFSVKFCVYLSFLVNGLHISHAMEQGCLCIDIKIDHRYCAIWIWFISSSILVLEGVSLSTVTNIT